MTNCNPLAAGAAPEAALAGCTNFVGTRRFPPKSAVSRRPVAIHVRRDPAPHALRDQLVVTHLPLVKVIAAHMHRSLPAYVDLEDMVQAGNLGLFDAASKYDYEQRVVFSTYAKHRIKGAILDNLRQLDWASREMRRRHKQVETATDELAAKLQRAPVEAEVAEKLGVDVEHLRTRMIGLRAVSRISASTRSREKEHLPAPDFPDKPEGQPDWICAHAELRGALSTAMKSLPERYQKVVRLYYNDEMTMKEIGGALGIQESRVSQIHKSALGKMAKVLETIGITSASQCMFPEMHTL
jgi:RNA polymerase sigma factor for flagellar operon FliA